MGDRTQSVSPVRTPVSLTSSVGTFIHWTAISADCGPVVECPYWKSTQSEVLTKPHTGKEMPHPSTTREGSKPCVTKWRRVPCSY